MVIAKNRARTIKYAQTDSFFAVLIFPSVLTCLSTLFKICNAEHMFNSVVCYTFFMAYLCVQSLKINSFKKSDFLICIAFFALYGGFYLLAIPEVEEYYKNMDVIVMLCLYIPFSVFIVRKTVDWNNLVQDDKYCYAADVLIIVSFILKTIDKTTVRTDYMSFSYDLLPIWGLVALIAVLKGKKFQWLMTGFSVIECLLYGSRGAIVFLVLLVLLVQTVKILRSKNAAEKILVFFILLILAIIIMILVLLLIIAFGDTGSSYVVNRLINGSFTGDSGRTELYGLCMEIISNMRFSIKGPFFERTILPKNQYAHNLFLELFISLGWIGGSLACIFIIGVLVKAFCKQAKSSNLYTLLWITITIFSRFLLSGSLYDEGRFWLSLAVICSLAVSYKIRGNENYERKITQRRKEE